MQLASRFTHTAYTFQSDAPLTDDQIRAIAPSIFGAGKHQSCSDRYWHIPTIVVLNALRDEGFQPFMVCQTRVRSDDRRAHTKHMIRLRHIGQIAAGEADELILLNSHDGSSCYQMLAGVFRFVCKNGLVCGNTHADIRLPHRKGIVDDVVQTAYTMSMGFNRLRERRAEMVALRLTDAQQQDFARSALALRYGAAACAGDVAPITTDMLLTARRIEDQGNSLWVTFNRVQENLLRGGLPARRRDGRRFTTCAVRAIDSSLRLNRGLWQLAEQTLQRQEWDAPRVAHPVVMQCVAASSAAWPSLAG